ncbi:hypothetical protein GW17_00051236 [Ensete ventricosum]|nr:hypothetical protein GW17_00051236 [Ensete ventricosum]
MKSPINPIRVEVFDLVVHIVTLLDVMAIVTMEAIVASMVVLFRMSLYRVGCLEEPFLPDLKKDLSPGGIERDQQWPWDSQLGPFHLSP